MKQNMLLLLSLAVVVFPQILLNSTSQNIYQILDPQEKALQYLFRSYPQISNYTNLQISPINRTGNTASINLSDYHFTLLHNSIKVQAIVTLSQLSPGQFISISPLITVEGSNHLSSSQMQNNNYFLQPANYIKTENGQFILKGLGLFQAFTNLTNLTDIRLNLALALINSLHPNMINYSARSIYYQIVSGINFLIRYKGRGRVTFLLAIVNVNLNMQPNLIAFEVHCQNNNYTLSINCTDQVAFKIFNALDALIITHPQLLSYKMISIVSDDSYLQDGIVFITTYENTNLKTRIMAEINIIGNIFRVLSFYTYAYTPQ